MNQIQALIDDEALEDDTSDVLSLTDARTVVCAPGAGNYSRMQAAMAMAGQMNPRDWWRLIGEIWTKCDDLWAFHDTLKRVLGTNGPIKDMMNSEELERFDTLPQRLTIYRGGWRGVPVGATWTLSRERAATFPIRAKYGMHEPMLYRARVGKANVIAVKLDSGHVDVITFSPRITSREVLSPANCCRTPPVVYFRNWRP